VALALLVLLLDVLQDVPGVGLVGDDADLAFGGCLLDESSGGVVQLDPGHPQLGGPGHPRDQRGDQALAPWFIAAGIAIGCVETSEHAAVAALAPVELRESAFGLLAAVQSFGNLAASAIAGLLWTAVSPRVAFSYLGAWMILALVGLLLAGHHPWTTSGQGD
jgi:hypothetical protein